MGWCITFWRLNISRWREYPPTGGRVENPPPACPAGEAGDHPLETSLGKRNIPISFSIESVLNEKNATLPNEVAKNINLTFSSTRGKHGSTTQEKTIYQ
ncbi:hypothetical protein A8C56_06325 [Niabella ginsenosidivorans]|uniref:Uncharacterized protein n=1 Tax=Niabella ginsenosidivorans TaxID=1176587 RepID=A0A1A9HZ13_9BACT|nr:hypothetical protein A8C56_06325 [Niabella ginsenosidivorans]